MKGLIVNCITGKATKIDDGKPMPIMPPYNEPEGVDLKKVLKMLTDYYKETK